MWARDGLRELIEQRLLDLGKFGGVHDLENIFHLVEKHDLFGTVDFRPVPQQAQDDLLKRQPGSIPPLRLGGAPLQSKQHPFPGIGRCNMLVAGGTCSGS